MKFGTEKMGQIIENIISEKLPHQDNVIIGENSSGKSLLLKEFIEKIGIGREIYFIDAVNRSFDVKKVINSHSRLENKATVLENRLKDMYFNLHIIVMRKRFRACFLNLREINLPYYWTVYPAR